MGACDLFSGCEKEGVYGGDCDERVLRNAGSLEWEEGGKRDGGIDGPFFAEMGVCVSGHVGGDCWLVRGFQTEVLWEDEEGGESVPQHNEYMKWVHLSEAEVCQKLPRGG